MFLELKYLLKPSIAGTGVVCYQLAAEGNRQESIDQRQKINKQQGSDLETPKFA